MSTGGSFPVSAKACLQHSHQTLAFKGVFQQHWPIADGRRRRANGLEAVIGLGFRKAMGLFAVTKGLGQSDYANDFVGSPIRKVCSLATL